MVKIRLDRGLSDLAEILRDDTYEDSRRTSRVQIGTGSRISPPRRVIANSISGDISDPDQGNFTKFCLSVEREVLQRVQSLRSI